MSSRQPYLDSAIVSRLRGLELRARKIAAGFVSGMHRSAYHGFSVEFADYRQYTPGDDLRYVDWRIFGRADRFYIKQYEEETNLRCNILLDASRSMAYGGGRPSKFAYACTLAASLAWLLTRQQDACGLVIFDHDIRTKLPPATGRAHLATLVKVLEQAEPAGQTDVKVLFHRLAEELHKRSMVILITDLLADESAVTGGLEHICYAGHELILLHVMDDHEWNLPFAENVQFEGLEDDLRLLADPQSLRASYLREVERYATRVRTLCLRHRADYVAVNTRDAVDGVLCGYLARRAGLLGGAARR